MNSSRDSGDVEWFLKELSKMSDDSGQNNSGVTQPEHSTTPNNFSSGNACWGNLQMERVGGNFGTESLIPNDWKATGGEATENRAAYSNETVMTAPTLGSEDLPLPDRPTFQSLNNDSNLEGLMQELKRRDWEMQQVNAKLMNVEEYMKNTSRWIEAHKAITMPLDYSTSTSWPNEGGIGGVQATGLDELKRKQEERDGELREIKEKIGAIEDYVSQATQWMKNLHETISRWADSP